MLVLDANILIRAALGSKTLLLLDKYSGRVEFFTPDVAFQDAREHLPEILARRKIAADLAMEILERLTGLVQTVEAETYALYEAVALERISQRDADDWPVLATALALGCPIWTEDTDFFGCGVATWTTDRVAVYLVSFPERNS